ncbi:tRNA (guanosine-2'-O-)-methyltransferase [Caldalkalibacillus uzonensis]|uniref:tRNA (guanosine(18)-2'-O)-methyltransferase n=1 Tax=Caldalkalibacillus uzonensis TaxID=353224 RepID=A0ABU0CX60_9BACI|nr:RNA methyltransferase [Caldalkalibacillus uzonensis]MDQ0340140.1 tRNA (guanosine-2'-O-)-methyltransferase [Caldalkalibacillus uzonensis]
MADNEREAIVAQLINEGLLTEEDDLVWKTLRPQRLRRMYEVLKQRTRHIAVLLEAVDDGHNQAAVLRSADAFGVQDVSIVVGRAPFSPNRKVTQSAHKWLTIERHPSIEAAVKQAQQRGYQVLASHLGVDAVPLAEVDLNKPTVFLFGNEHDGVSHEALELADGNFIIPMYGFVQSLNISVAAAITLHQATQRARHLLGDDYFLTTEERKELFHHWLVTSSARVRRMVEAGGPMAEEDTADDDDA